MFSKGWQGLLLGISQEGSPREIKEQPKENSEEQPVKNTVLPDSIIQIYIIFQIGFFTFQNSNILN